LPSSSRSGPGGHFPSQRSQRSRLEAILARNGIRPGDQKAHPAAAVSSEDAKNASSIVRYLHFTHGIDALQPLFTTDLRTVVSDTSIQPTWNERRANDVIIMDLLEIPYIDEWRPTGSYLYFSAAARQPVAVAGYALLYKGIVISPSDTLRKVGKDSLLACLTDNGSTLVIGRLHEPPHRIPLGSFINELLSNYSSQGRMRDIPAEKMTLREESRGLSIQVNVQELRVQREGDGAPVQSLTADLLLAFPSP
jgi:hypothetical protein